MLPAKERYKYGKRNYYHYYINCSLRVLYWSWYQTVCIWLNPFSFILRGEYHCWLKETPIQSSLLTELFPQYHGNFEEKEEISSSFERNTWKYLEPSVTEHSWSRNGSRIRLAGFWRDRRELTKRLSKDISWTESRFLGALSKLDEFLLNSQIRTCSVAVPGTSRNSHSENREPTGGRSPDDRCPEARISSDHSGNLNSSEVEEYPHNYEELSFDLSFFGFFMLWNIETRNTWKKTMIWYQISRKLENCLYDFDWRNPVGYFG